MATRRRTSTGTTRRPTGTSRRRSTRSTSGYAPRRRRRSTAASFGSAFGLVLVWVVVKAPWWVKIVAVLVAVVGLVAYVLVTRRSDGADAPDGGTDPQTDPQPAPLADPAGPSSTDPAPPSEGTPA